MSWNNVLPWWVYAMIAEKQEAMMLCAFEDEVLSGLTRSAPEHLYSISKNSFDTWKKGGWNYEEDKI